MKDVLYPLCTICEFPILGKQHEGDEETEVNDEVENAQRFQEVEMASHNECQEDIDSIVNNSTAYSEDESEDSLEEEMDIDNEDGHGHDGGDLINGDAVLSNSSMEQHTSENLHNMVNIRKLDLSPLVPSDIITLDYIVNEELISKLEGNETISLNFSKKLKSITKNQVNCLFLDGDKWNTTGMTVGSIDGENIECFTNHLSSFTMVVLDAEVSQSNKVALNYISYIGSALSLAGLLFTCIIYIVLYKDLQILTTSRHLVHFNLQIALGLTQIVFLAGGNATQNE
ncbi:adhesion G- coupled receptor D1-like, partial [Paramuricea clavata]